MIALVWGWGGLWQIGAGAADWPMWRGDAGRTGISSEALPEPARLQWVREYPPLRPAFWQARQERLQFDLGYEPVALGNRLFVASSRNDSVTALDAETGEELWRFYADGPVRLAPVAWEGKVFFGADDGWFYCLAADSGKLEWKVAPPSPRKVLGNGRLISVWPARGGAVVAGGRVYFAAGVWPFEGIFVQALEAGSGKSLWINDRLGTPYAAHPHGAMSFGGPAPQGYLLMNRGRLVMPGSRAFPAFLNPGTGELLSFEFGHGGHGSRPGSWFVAGEADGGLAVDSDLNTETHDAGEQVIGQRGVKRAPGEVLPERVVVGAESYHIKAGLARAIRVGHRELRFQDGFPGVEGTIHTMLAAGGRLFVVTRAGAIYCFGNKPVEPRRYPARVQPLKLPKDEGASLARAVLQTSGAGEGYVLVWGASKGRLAEELAARSPGRVVAVDRRAEPLATWRRQLDAAGLYGEKIAVHTGDALQFGWPPYLASLIVCEDLATAGFNLDNIFIDTAYQVLRPYGGVLCLGLSDSQHEALAALVNGGLLAGAQVRREGGFSLVVRAGPLPGAANYAGEPTYDELVKAPVGLLWFGDTFHHHKLFYQGITPESGRGLPPYLHVVDGVMSYRVTEPIGVSPTNLSYADFLRQVNAQPHVQAFTDIYTGRTLPGNPPTRLTSGTRLAAPKADLPLTRNNPITGRAEAREFVKNHGCDLAGVDYGNLITMRSGTAAFYDKRLESGTINISGLRSGCRNTIIPAGGVLNLPAWTGNCSCNYPVFTSMALVPMPESFEQWSAWGGLAEDGPIERVGINFGAPGDRMTADGTLWLDWPSVGGPSPDVRVQVTPATVEPFYRHSLWMKGGSGWPWVFASGIKGVQSVRLETLARAATNAPGFSARWTGFVRPEQSETNVFYARADGTIRLWVDGFPVLDSSRYRAGAAPPELTGRLFLEAGRNHTLQAEYEHPAPARKGGATNGPAFAALSWSSPSRPKSLIPTENLLTPDGRRGGLAGVYFANARAAGPGLAQVDRQISFDWGAQPPPRLRNLRQAVVARERTYTVRLVFAEPESLRVGERVFGVKLQGKTVFGGLDVLKEAGGAQRGLVREFKGIKATEALELEFLPETAQPPLISGFELIAEQR